MYMSLTLALLFASQAGFEDLDQLNLRLAEASGDRAVALDPRLRLKRCPEPATITSDPGGALTVHCPATGWRIRVAMASENPRRDVAAPLLVQRGSSVAVTIKGDDFSLGYQAVAVEAGRKGDSVRVKFAAAGPVLMATVAGPGRVEIVD